MYQCRLQPRRMKVDGEVVQESFMEWLENQWLFGGDFDLNITSKPRNYLKQFDNKNLSEWDGRFDEDTEARFVQGIKSYNPIFLNSIVKLYNN